MWFIKWRQRHRSPSTLLEFIMYRKKYIYFIFLQPVSTLGGNSMQLGKNKKKVELYFSVLKTGNTSSFTLGVNILDWNQEDFIILWTNVVRKMDNSHHWAVAPWCKWDRAIVTRCSRVTGTRTLLCLCWGIQSNFPFLKASDSTNICHLINN